MKHLYLLIPQALTQSSVREAVTKTEQFPSDVEDVMTITRLCIGANVFQWKNKMFKQIQGLPMGSSALDALAQ